MVKTYPRLIASGKKVLKSSGVYKKKKRNAKNDDEQTRVTMSPDWF